MELYLYVRINGINQIFGILNHSNYQRLKIENEFIIDIYKRHNHLYEFKAFFYKSKCIYPYRSFRSKKELYCALQNLLQQELYDV